MTAIAHEPEPTCSLDTSYAACVTLTRRTAGNFYYSFLTLPAAQFRAMCALYAFMRITDDLGDQPDTPAEQRRADLDAWQTRFEQTCARVAGSPRTHAESRRSHAGAQSPTEPESVLPAVADIVARYAIPAEYFQAVIAGVRMDLEPVAIGTFPQLERYCYHVAGVVGLACIQIWGYHDRRALDAAVACGLAFQLTNILRDIPEDARLGRVYLPRDDLDRFGVRPEDLASGLRDERFLRLMAFETERARGFYAQARQLFAWLAPPGRPILDAMLQIYGGLLDEIERRQFDVFSQRVSLPRWKKLAIAAVTVVRWKLRTWVVRNPAPETPPPSTPRDR